MNRLLAKIAAPFIRKSLVGQDEGGYRPGPWQLPVSGGWLPVGVGEYVNWWQLGFDPVYGSSNSAIVEACVSAYAQTVAMCPGDHWKSNDKGGRTRITNSALSRILRYPNDYQSISDFMMNLTRNLYLTGNAYALALRNDRFEIDELHPMDPDISRPMVASTGDVFYQLGGNDVIQNRLTGSSNQILTAVPMRDVLHIRLNTQRQWPRPLLGQSPLEAAMQDIGLGSAITAQQMRFYQNEARPSAVLSTDLVLDKEQVAQLRDRWDEQSKGLRQGGTPILTAGLKVQPWGVSGGKESAIADIAKMSKENIALAFRVPLQILGIGGTPFSSTELLMQSWIASGLGFCLNHIEEAFGFLYNCKGQPDEYVEFSTDALLRSAYSVRIEGLARGVQGGIYSPNEARNMEGLDDVKFGDEPRVQQQVVPLSAAAQIQAQAPGSTGPKPPSAPGPDAPPAPPSAASAEAPKAPAPKEPKGNPDDIKREARKLFAAVERAGRRYSQ
jgi:HK97 family phage portal protein